MHTTETKIMITAQDVKPGDSYVGLFDQPRQVVKVITKADKTLVLFNDDCSRSHDKSHIVTVIRKVPQVSEGVCPNTLAAQLVNYCGIKTLSLGGLVERIKAAGTMTRETADAVIEYCQENSLTLGGLLCVLAGYSNSVADAEVSPVNMTAQEISDYILRNWSDYNRVPKCVNAAHLEATDNTLATFQENGQESTPVEFYAAYMRNLEFVLTCTEFGTAEACEWFQARGVKL